MAALRWARLIADVNCGLRRGAWYAVRQVRALEATLDVPKRALTVPRSLLEIVTRPPATWALVPRPAGARNVPAWWGAMYAVCPQCRSREPVSGRPERLRCGRCNGLFDVEWDDAAHNGGT